MKRIAELLLIRQDEVQRTAFFILFFIIMGAGLAVGKGSADALFIKRYGVENFPYVYMVLSVALAFSCILYAAYVDRLASEKFFRIIFGLQLFVLVATSLVIHLFDNDLIYPVYYLVYSISNEMLLVHGAVYIGQNFHTLQAKRLTPLIFAGYQIGMIAGGLGLIFIIPLVGLSYAPLFWVALVLVAGLMLFIWHRGGASPYYFHTSKSSKSKLSSAVNEVKEGIVFTGKTSLLRNASYALFFMVITHYMLSFAAHSIYTDVFDEEEALTSFFGALVVATNLFALVIQLLLTNRIIQKFGIRKSNYIYPVTTILSFTLLLIYPGFYAALIASFNRESIMPAIRTPVRQLFFNVLPDKLKGRARAISVAIVMPLALCVCGMMIIYLKQYEGVQPVAAAGLVCGVIYLLFTTKMGRDYISTLINSMKEKLYLPDDDSLRYNDSSPELIGAMKRGLASDNTDVSLSYARAIIMAYPGEAFSIILERVRTLDVKTADQMLKMLDYESGKEYMNELDDIASSGDRHIQATVFDVVVAADEDRRHNNIDRALHQDNPRLQVSAVFAAYMYSGDDIQRQALEVWRALLDASEGEKLAALRLMPLLDELDADVHSQMQDKYHALLPGLLSTNDRQRCLTVLDALQHTDTTLPDEIAALIRPFLVDDVPSLRAAATGLLYKITSGQQCESALWMSLADGHEKVRQAAICSIMNHNPDYTGLFNQWLLNGNKGVPRAQMTLLHEVMQDKASYDVLERIIMVKAKYAASLLAAVEAIEAIEATEAGNAAALLLVALRERLEQTCDLILACIQPVLGMSSISVIRAGLNSRDERHIANAIEALDGLDNNILIELIVGLVKRESASLFSLGVGVEFRNIDEVTGWCTSLDDWWLKMCGENVMNADVRVAHA